MVRIIILLFIFTSQVFAQSKTGKENHNLVIIQKVSTDRSSFVIRKGKKDQIFRGQKSLFSTKNSSFVAKAVAVNRIYSQWVPIDSGSTVPFQNGDIINLSYSVEKVWSEIPRLIGDENYRLTLQKEKRAIEIATDEKKEEEYLRPKFQVIVGNFTSLNESTTDVESTDGTRTGFKGELRYLRPYNKNFFYQLGARFNSESYVETSPSVTEDSSRFFITGGFTAKIYELWEFKSVPYLAIDLGIGYGSTNNGEESKTGIVTLLPSVKLGIEFAWTKNLDFLTEVFFESMSADESYTDGDVTSTTTNSTLIGLNLGLQF